MACMTSHNEVCQCSECNEARRGWANRPAPNPLAPPPGYAAVEDARCVLCGSARWWVRPNATRLCAGCGAEWTAPVPSWNNASDARRAIAASHHMAITAGKVQIASNVFPIPPDLPVEVGVMWEQPDEAVDGARIVGIVTYLAKDGRMIVGLVTINECIGLSGMMCEERRVVYYDRNTHKLVALECGPLPPELR